MKRLVLIIIVLGGIGGGVWYMLDHIETNRAAATADTALILPPVKVDDRVQAEAKVVPVQHASLSLAVGGIVEELLVGEGQAVAGGQLLLRV